MIPHWYLIGTSLVPLRHPKKYENKRKKGFAGFLEK